MKRHGFSHATLMLLVCTLPLLVFFALALAGIPINPLLIPLVLIVCFFSMFYMISGSCGHQRRRLTSSIR